MTATAKNAETGHDIKKLAERFGVPWAEVEQDSREMDRVLAGVALQDLRLAKKVTQRELARRLGVSQNRISKIERGQFEKTQLGTIQRYIQALGGHLSVTATFGDSVIPLRLG